MKILVGHTNMDMDCLGSLVLGRYLYPEHIPVKSRLIHPVAQNIYNLYKNHLNFMRSQELKGKNVSSIIVFDTRSQSRIKEYFEYLNKPWKGEMIIYDHHQNDTSDLQGAQIYESDYGSNTTLIAKNVMDKKITIDPIDATIALSGLFADTGNFTHNNVKPEDFEVAQWLMKSGANMNLVREFLNSLNQDYQINLFHQVLNNLEYKKVHGHSIIISRLNMKQQVNGLAAIIEKAFEVENPDAIFSIFGFTKAKNCLIISRSKTENINLYPIMKNWGGGGHSQAGAARVKDMDSETLKKELHNFLHDHLEPALNAERIMTRNVLSVNCNWSVLQTSKYLEEISHTGAPVVKDNGDFCGMISLRDISKARKVDQMKSPVKSYMTRKVYTCNLKTTIQEIGKIMSHHNIGHIPVIESNKVVGLITRADYLKYIG